ncbi:pentapeptide repeat-containing protein [Vreelandella alkaliphila]|uniref:pentapeptide repeat-containing protein n=1 Tax=Vreelandella alkaliphila TaxID=272774 RepID=UPI0039F44BB7
MGSSKKEINRKKQALRRLESGIDVFNQWRATFPTIRVDFAFEELKGRDLSMINLNSAKLRRTDFSGSIMQNVTFRGANLNGSNLSNVDASFADFEQARLAGANLSDACIDGANLYATIKDGWDISSIKCSYCWVTKDRNSYPDEPDVFMEGEFETIYGGKKFKIRFPDGFQSIDMLALPFHVKKILDQYPGSKIVFTGLSAVGEPGLEFQVYKDLDVNIDALEKRFSEVAREIRLQVYSIYEEQLKLKEETIENQKFLIGTMMSLLNSDKSTVNNFYFDKVDQSMEQYSGRDIKVSKQFYFNDQASLDKLANDLEMIKDKMENPSGYKLESIGKIKNNARKGDSEKVKEGLISSGKWLLDTSTKIGADVATAAIKSVLGI